MVGGEIDAARTDPTRVTAGWSNGADLDAAGVKRDVSRDTLDAFAGTPRRRPVGVNAA